MRGTDDRSGSLFSYVDLESRVRRDLPLRAIRVIANTALLSMTEEFAALYPPRLGRPSIPPERLLRAMLLQAFYGIRSERQLMEAWASIKSFRRKDGSAQDGGGADGPAQDGRNVEHNSHGEKRSNETHQSTTDPQARLYRRGDGQPARLCYMGHALMENRHGLARDGGVTLASGTAGREAALALLDRRVAGCGPRRRRITLGADKAYDVKQFVHDLRARSVIPHIAIDGHLTWTGKRRTTAIDARTTRRPGYEISQRCRKRIEEVFGWIKASAGLARVKLRERRRVDAAVTLALAADNLIRLPKLLAAPA